LATDGEGDHLATDFVAAFEHHDFVAGFLEDARGRQPGNACTNDSDSHGTTTCSSTSTVVMRLNDTPKLQRRISPRIVVGIWSTPWATMAYAPATLFATPAPTSTSLAAHSNGPVPPKKVGMMMARFAAASSRQ